MTFRFGDSPAPTEGEGPYDAWRDAHIAYLGRNGGDAPDMMPVCERFRVVHVFGGNEKAPGLP